MKTQLFPTAFDTSNPDHVCQLQYALKFLGYDISSEELELKIIGDDTKAAINRFCEDCGIENICGVICENFITKLNDRMNLVYRITGTVKNSENLPFYGAKLKIYKKGVSSLSDCLGLCEVLSDGTYCMFFELPVDNNKTKNKFGAQIHIYAPKDEEQQNSLLDSNVFFIKSIETIFNIEYDFERGLFNTFYSNILDRLRDEKADDLRLIAITNLPTVAEITGVNIQDVRKLRLAQLISDDIKKEYDFSQELFGILYQNYPNINKRIIIPEKLGIDYFSSYFISKFGSNVSDDFFTSESFEKIYKDVEDNFDDISQLSPENRKSELSIIIFDAIVAFYSSLYFDSDFLDKQIHTIIDKIYSSNDEWISFLKEAWRPILNNYLFHDVAYNEIYINVVDQIQNENIIMDEGQWKSYLKDEWIKKMQADFDADESWKMVVAILAEKIISEHCFCFIDPVTEDYNLDAWNTQLISEIEIALALMAESQVRNIIDDANKKFIITSDEDHVLDLLVKLKNLQNEKLVESPILPGETSIGNLLQVKFGDTINDQKKQKVAQIFLNCDGNIKKIEEELIKNTDIFSLEDVVGLVDTFALGQISQNRISFLEHLITDNVDIKNLASWSNQDWHNYILDFNTNGGNINDIDDYAYALYNNCGKLHPDIRTIEKIDAIEYNKNHGLQYLGDIMTFIIDHSKFDLLTSRISDDFFEGTGNEAEKRNELKIVQRVYRISPNPDCAAVLLNEKIHSAGQLYSLGKENIKNLLTKYNISDKDAEEVFRIATNRYAGSLAAYTCLSNDLTAFEPRLIRPDVDFNTMREELRQEFPDIDSLFGSSDYCTCKHCASVYSPSAYLADVLRFLHGFMSKLPKNSGFYNVREVLQLRRPDIEQIKLNCPNSDTPMPYIDLVNEILEHQFAPANTAFNNQTTLTAKELLAAPEYVYAPAYEILKDAKYPLYSSFNIYLQEIRVFLEKSGVTRHEVLTDFQKEFNPPLLSDLDIAAEYFSLTAVDKDYITNPTNNTISITEAWHLATNTNDSYSIMAQDFMSKSGLTCHEMFELKHNVDWVGLLFDENEENPCSCDSISISGNFAAFDRAHRFIRLWRKTSFEMWELNLILKSHSINSIDINNPNKINIVELMNFDKLRKRLKMRPEHLLAFYENINTEVRHDFDNNLLSPLYDILFLTKSFNNEVNPSLLLNDSRDNFADQSVLTPPFVGIESVRHTVISALPIKDSDFDLLVQKIEKNPAHNEVERTFSNLALIYRYAKFAKALKISIEELIMLKSLSVVPDFMTWFDVSQTLEVINTFATIKGLKIPIRTVYYLLKYTYDLGANSDIEFTAGKKQKKNSISNSIIRYYNELHPIAQSIKDTYDTSTLASNSVAFTKQYLARLSEPFGLDSLAMVDDIINGTSIILLDNEAKKDFINSHFKEFIPETANAIDFLVTNNSNPTDRNAFIQSYLIPYFAIKFLLVFAPNKSVEDNNRLLRIIKGNWNQSSYLENREFLLNYFSEIWGTSNNIDIYLQSYTNEVVERLLQVWFDPNSNPPNQIMPSPQAITINDYVIRSIDIFSFIYNSRIYIEVRPLANKYISSEFGISVDVASILSDNLKIQIPTELVPLKLIDFLISENVLFALPNNVTNDTNIFKCFALLAKCCLLISESKMTDDEAKWYVKDYLQSIGGINWNGFQVLPGDISDISLSDIEKIATISMLNKNYPAIPDEDNLFENNCSVYSILLMTLSTSTPDYTDIANALEQLIGYKAIEIKTIVNHLLASSSVLTLPPKIIVRLLNCLQIAAKINCSATNIINWISNADLIAESQQIKAGLKARHTIDEWLEFMPGMQKIIREGKCDALCNYLIEHEVRNAPPTPRWKDRNDLYFYFLIDTEMTACMQTSRIKLAMSSVQLFVQRCFLNLEPSVSTDHKDWDRWKWMKNYRVWEANRKVFLYPENWIEPELRDDKTPIFKELEDELNQSDITNDLAEDVYHNYLLKLDEISRLHVCGVYHETDEDTNMLHVIGRTTSTPHIYYYRTYNGDTGNWSAWSKIDIDIKGDIVLPVVYNRRLHLFWLLNVEKSMKGDDYDNTPYMYNEIQLCWSILKKGKWSGAKIGHKKIYHGQESWDNGKRINVPLKNILLSSIIDAGVLLLSIYKTGENIDRMGGFYFDEDVLQSHVYSDWAFFNDSWQKPNLTEEDKKWLRYTYIERYLDKIERTARPQIIDNNYNDWFGSPFPLAFDNNYVMNFKGSNPNVVAGQGKPSSNPYVLAGEGKGDGDVNNVSYFGNVFIEKDYQTFSILQTLNVDKTLSVMHSGNSGSFRDIINNNFTNTQFFFNDAGRVFSIEYDKSSKSADKKYKVLPFYHPYTKLFIRELNHSGLSGILNRNIQVNPDSYPAVNTWSSNGNPTSPYDFNTYYHPQHGAYTPNAYKKEIVDFAFGAPYSVYNWELFFHAPLYIACNLSTNQKFEDAMKWFHVIFNPMDSSNSSGTQKYWVTKPFYMLSTQEIQKENITNILKNIEDFSKQVIAWMDNPFNPHLIARYRPVAYQRTVVMKYIDNLIAWGDQLFRRDTIESINEATLLYILASEILGERPRKLPSQVNPTDGYTFNEILQGEPNGDISILQNIENHLSINALPDHIDWNMPHEGISSMDTGSVMLKSLRVNEQVVKPSSGTKYSYENHVGMHGRYVKLGFGRAATDLPLIDSVHFCIPFNDQLLTYWDTVEDRLFKIRHCMNIEGVERQLPLFEPPIDPALLVKAYAMGLDISDVLNDLAVPHPNYKFRVLVQKAMEYCGEVKQLGEKILSTLEKRDAESLTLLRSTQEINLQEAMKQIKKLQIAEADANISAQNIALDMANAKLDYYTSREFMNGLESAAFGLGIASNVMTLLVAPMHTISGFLNMVPDIETGFSGPFPKMGIKTITGSMLSSPLNGGIGTLNTIVQAMDKQVSQMLTKSSYNRRKEEWDFQAKLAKIEIKQLERQLLAAEIRKQISEKDLENTELQIEQLKTTDEYYHSKFTNEALYNWMLKQVVNFYYKSYQLAFDMAKKAEKCYRYELGIAESESSFINYGYWDSAKKGLLAGDRLMFDLHQLDAAYINKNKRHLELTKHVSLAQMFPQQLLTLIHTGEVVLDLPEWLFNMDYPGHYMRRIKSVSISIPNVAGPYTGVNCTLSLLNHKVRISNLSGSGYAEDTEESGLDNRFVYSFGASQSIATSHGQNDSGMFELNFNDERYLPFEGAGVISNWKLVLPKDTNMFNFNSLSDVILHINYTALDAGSVLAQAALADLHEKLPPQAAVLLSLKHDFPEAWNEMLENEDHEMTFELKEEQLPYFAKYNGVKNAANLVALCINKDEEDPCAISNIDVLLENDVTSTSDLISNNNDELLTGSMLSSINATGIWKLTIADGDISKLENVLFGIILTGDDN